MIILHKHTPNVKHHEFSIHLLYNDSNIHANLHCLYAKRKKKYKYFNIGWYNCLHKHIYISNLSFFAWETGHNVPHCSLKICPSAILSNCQILNTYWDEILSYILNNLCFFLHVICSFPPYLMIQHEIEHTRRTHIMWLYSDRSL